MKVKEFEEMFHNLIAQGSIPKTVTLREMKMDNSGKVIRAVAKDNTRAFVWTESGSVYESDGEYKIFVSVDELGRPAEVQTGYEMRLNIRLSLS